ncbi:MAG: hypothetical protein ABIH48_00975 [Candidatus Falkowbacteria bacterium]
MVLPRRDSSLQPKSTIISKFSQVGRNKKPSDFYDLVNGFGRLMGLLWCLQDHLELSEQKVIDSLLNLLINNNQPENAKGENLWLALEELFPTSHIVYDKKVKAGILIDNLIIALQKDRDNIIQFPTS